MMSRELSKKELSKETSKAIPNGTLFNLVESLFILAEEKADKIALLSSQEGLIPYGELLRQWTCLAGAMEQLGIQTGDKVALLLHNTPSFVLAYFALLSIGVVVVPLNTRLTAVELDTLLIDSQARLLISSLEFYNALSGLNAACLEGIILDTNLVEDDATLDGILDTILNSFPLNCALYRLNDLLSQDFVPSQSLPYLLQPDTLATLIYTSGTTGKPKGVMLSHHNLFSDAHANMIVIEASEKDRFITVSPFFHVFGQTNTLISALLSGADIVLIRKFSPRTVLEAIARHRVTFMAAVPTMYQMMLVHLREKSYNLSSLRVCHSGASPMAVETFRDVEQFFGAPVQEGYGLSEASSIVCSNPLKGLRQPGSVGLPLMGIRIKILLDGGEEAAPHEVGELYVQGDVVMLGYFERPEETQKTLISFPDGIWLKTRDLGFKDDAGYIYIVDRTDDLINIGGVKIYPREVEEVLYRHPAVQAAAVTGIPSSMHHEAIKAFVVLRENTECGKENLQQFCRQYLAAFKVPRYYEFVQEIPQGATGKILRKNLRSDT